MSTSNLYELVVVLATTLALSAAILGWTSVKTEGRKIICTWDGRFGRVKALYLGVSALAVFVILVENLNTLYRLLGANREETIAVAYGLILGTVGLTVLLQSAIIRFSGKWHRLKLTEQLYREMKAEQKKAQRTQRTQRTQAKPAAKVVQTPRPQQVRRAPAPRSDSPKRGMYDCLLDEVIYPDYDDNDNDNDKVVNIRSRQKTSAKDMQAAAEAIAMVTADALRDSGLSIPPLDVKKIDVLLLARSEDGTAQSVAELGDPTKLPDQDQAYRKCQEDPEITYQDCPPTLTGGTQIAND